MLARALHIGVIRNDKNMQTESLGQIAAEHAMRAARLYLTQHNLAAENDPLVAAVKRHCKLCAAEALADAKEAFRCGMVEIGQRTFLASFTIAGCDAAKEIGTPVSVS